MRVIITIALLFFYGIFYVALGNLLVTSLLFGRISLMAIFGLLFVTIHMILMLMGVNKIGRKQRSRTPRFTPRQSSIHVDEPMVDNCGFDHIVDTATKRICPFCGKPVRFEDVVCPHCRHEI